MNQNTGAPIGNDFRNEGNREELFRNCYHNIFKIAIENNIKTIAIPCIGTVIYGCPIELGRNFAFDEAKKVEDKFDKIYFVCFRDVEFEAYSNWNKYDFEEINKYILRVELCYKDITLLLCK